MNSGKGMCFIMWAVLSLPTQASAWNAQALADADLDEVRGGFLTQEGLRISFGIERAVSLNGVPQVTQNLRVNEAEFAAAAAGADLAGLVDDGGFAPIEVIQNNLDGQVLQTVTVVDVRMVGLDLLRRQERAAFLSDQIMLLAR